MNDHHLIGAEWIKKDKIAFIFSNGSTTFVTFDSTTCDLVEIVSDKFLQSKFQCEHLINGTLMWFSLIKFKGQINDILLQSLI